MSFWDDNPGAEARAQEMWDIKGMTATAIARVLGATPHTITGMARRQDWKPRGSPIKPVEGLSQKETAHARVIFLRSLPLKVATSFALPPVRSCQWLVNDRRPWRFCEAAPIVPGKSYCAEHCARAFAPHRMRDTA